jgi:hypothetical protein
LKLFLICWGYVGTFSPFEWSNIVNCISIVQLWLLFVLLFVFPLHVAIIPMSSISAIVLPSSCSSSSLLRVLPSLFSLLYFCANVCILLPICPSSSFWFVFVFVLLLLLCKLLLFTFKTCFLCFSDGMSFWVLLELDFDETLLWLHLKLDFDRMSFWLHLEFILMGNDEVDYNY